MALVLFGNGALPPLHAEIRLNSGLLPGPPTVTECRERLEIPSLGQGGICLC